jgi:ABC-type nitrate/sulfonate/bicarbonate transport system ATPase subunit
MPEPVAGAPLIELCSVSKVFATGDGAVHALRDVSFGIGKGEFDSILGPSGCGKTTLMMIMVGLTAADAGEARIAGQRISTPFTDSGIVFQTPELLEWRTALDNILLQIEVRRLPGPRLVAPATAPSQRRGAVLSRPGESCPAQRPRPKVACGLNHSLTRSAEA